MVHVVAPETINTWSDVEKEFLHRFLEDDIEISVHSLLAHKQREDETVKGFIDHFREMLMRCLHGISQEKIVETCKYNFQTCLLIKMGVVEFRTWKDLVKHGEQAEDIIRSIVKHHAQSRISTNWLQLQSSRPKGKEAMTT